MAAIDDGLADDRADRAEAAVVRVLQLPFNGGAVRADFKPLRGDD